MRETAWDGLDGKREMAQRLCFGASIANAKALANTLALASALTMAGGVCAEQVVRVKDGDSLVVASGGKNVDVRLADIDAPEYRQPHGDAARSALLALVGDREVRLQLVGGDAYRRIVAHVYAGNVDVNEQMVRRGHAWVRREYDPAPKLVAAEDAARAERVGLWREATPMPPWEWRKSKRSAGKRAKSALATVAPIALGPIPKVQCDTKRYCGEMASCEEAVAFLRQCAVNTLDGDGDGTPCETLCRAYKMPDSQ